MSAVGKCITGIQRKNNEDAIFISDGSGFFKNCYIVADGMGGHNAGEVASNLAIDAFHEYQRLHHGQEEEILDALVGGVQYANSIIYEKASFEEGYSGMGTTFLATALDENKLYVAHVGDSRLYLFRDGTLKQMTRDHSYVMEMVKVGKMTLEEAKNHPNRNVITRSLGTEATVDIDTLILDIKVNDLIMLCTDGLSNMVPEEEMIEILKSGKSLFDQVEELTASANRNGGLDNISVILIQQEVL